MNLKEAINIIDNNLIQHGILPEHDWEYLKEHEQEIVRLAEKIKEEAEP